jgi:hypothetical protein
MTDYSACLDWVMPDLPMAPPTTLVVNAIRDAVIELCERSLCYRQELQQILVLAPVSTVTTAAAAQFATAVVVDSITDFNAGDTLKVELTDGTWWRGHVSGTPAASTINLDGQLNQAVEVSATVTKFVDQYAITLPTGYAMAKCLFAWLNDSPIDPMSPDDVDTEFNNTSFGWVGVNWRTDVRLPSRFYMQDDGTVNLLLPPEAGGNLRLQCALKPTRASTSFPTLLYERYIETIAHGAKARIMLIPKKPYSDKELGAWHNEKFNSLVAEAKIRVARGNTRGPLRTHTVFALR